MHCFKCIVWIGNYNDPSMTTWDVYLKPRINNGDKNYPKLNWCNRTILDINSISLPSANLGDILFDHADCLPSPWN